MKKVSAVSEIPTLLITSELIEQVTTILTEPFNSMDEAEQIWAELKCQLWHITNLNDLPTDQASKDRLLHAIEYPEWIESLDSDTQISLTVVADDGQGLYLLLSNHITFDEIKDAYHGN
ncbi:hypothetical protein [Psychromonas ossibalaenae]|uniref:hypothetical protein n=1 Tax=Psychromonas ossibalaenae TaxID=444922 RepID=UPI0003606794|nr:hypothetical protein [Psychromonas ossibalaenae]